MRKHFIYKGELVTLYDVIDGWRYYKSKNKNIKCKGAEVISVTKEK